ncbi:hypothetical protein [Maridesulfovibrio sp. FT414]|uniref:hypothetical protein n=1 Tax=Maridesulfovibrio sp. FT414 TaxID=2979469 RepID=UPI003D8025EA
MIQSKVDTRFLGTIQNTFYGLPPLPQPVKIFFSFIALGIVILLVRYVAIKYSLVPLITEYLNARISAVTDKLNALKGSTGKSRSETTPVQKTDEWKASTDHDVLERLVLEQAQADVFGERSGQRTLAAVVNIAGTEGINVVVTFKDMVTASLFVPGSEVKLVFDEFLRGDTKINACVGRIKSFTPDKGAVITRTSSFGYIKRRVFARRKVADQRFIKIKVWRIQGEDYDIDYLLDNSEPDIIIDNRKDLPAKTRKAHVVDISKGGLAIIGSIRDGGHEISRNDKVILCMLIYMPARKTFQPHLIYAEARGSRSMGLGMTRLSFQFLRSLKIPPRKRSTLFKGQAVMAMTLANPE